MWLAPNLVTLTGFVIYATMHSIFMWHCPVGHCPAETPPWVFYCMTASVLAYQNLDNCDGKQARRTGTSSPLGEFFDHGVDALIITMGPAALITALNLGYTWILIALATSGWGLFYLGTWVSYAGI